MGKKEKGGETMEKRERRTVRFNLWITPTIHNKLKAEKDRRAEIYPKTSMNDLIIEAIEALLSQPWKDDKSN